ncbi:protein phosphatase 2C domain-containing protein [Streptomyces sp. SID3343]|uniref:protein phosphatase 2C domain-containing protein n=1 Tax=Streptomyces sp. SID3343 TaxID=2690260 RepID=UPI001927FC4F
MASERFVLVLDGATANGLATGCVHDVPWVVSRLAAQISGRLIADGEAPLADVLAEGIGAVCGLHADTCDLGNPDSPSSTVAMVRHRGAVVDYLVLCDSPIVIEATAGDVRLVRDDAMERLPGQSPEILRDVRNRPGGFWVASTEPEAAKHAVVGSIPAADVRRVAVMTDGVSRLFEWYGWSLGRLLGELADAGPAALVASVREAERRAPVGRFPGKRHDDATVALCTHFDPFGP